MNVSKHITLYEAIKSPTAMRYGIDNTPNDSVLKNMENVANYCFEPLREWYEKPIRINSFYRSVELNKKVGGKTNPVSQHTKGEAIDMDAGSREENKKLFDWCKANLIYDQLINEYNFSWVHISYTTVNTNRNEIVAVK